MEMEKNSTLKYGIWLTGASMMFVSAWFCVRLTGTVGEMGRYLDSMDSVVCMEELLDYEKEENGRALEENDLAEPTLQVRMLEREDSAAAVSDSTQLSISSADYQVLLKIVEAEAGSEDLNGRILVANVVLNRVKSELFPDCVTDVVYQHSNGVYQFSPVKNGTIDTVSISEETKQAVELALDGTDLSDSKETKVSGVKIAEFALLDHGELKEMVEISDAPVGMVSMETEVYLDREVSRELPENLE